MDTISTSQQKAKKEHKCNFCGFIIPIGEKYHRQAIKGDTFYIWKSHLRCMEIVSKLDMHESCDEGVSDADFHEIICEEFHKIQGDREDYEIPEFKKQLEAVCYHYGI